MNKSKHICFKLLLLSLPLAISIQLNQHSLEIPSELIMVVLVAIIGWNLINRRFRDLRFLKHPITFASILWLLWMTIGIFSSYDPIISLKYSIVSIGHWTVFFVGFGMLKIKTEKILEKWFNYYASSLVIIFLLVFYNYSKYDFRMDASVLVARPFYFDHAYLSSCLSLLVGIYGAKVIVDWNTITKWKWIYRIIFVLLLSGVIFFI